jgi:hypothetical protein
MRLAGWKSRQMLGRYGASAGDAHAHEAHRRLSPATVSNTASANTCPMISGAGTTAQKRADRQQGDRLLSLRPEPLRSP